MALLMSRVVRSGQGRNSVGKPRRLTRLVRLVRMSAEAVWTMANRRRVEVRGPGWQLQSAKARFSELFRKVREEGPQLVTRQGKEGVVVVAVEDFVTLTKKAKRQPLSRFMAESPLAGLELRIERSREQGRKVEL